MKSYIETLFRWAAPTTALPSKLVLQDTQPLIKQIEQTLIAGPNMWRTKDDRVSKTTEELELTITKAVRTAPGCEAFVGVIVQRITPRSRLGATWELRGIKFGRADRKVAREALTPIVERMQREFRLTNGPIKGPMPKPPPSTDSPAAD